MLKEKILQNLNIALKDKKELEVSVLRLINAAIFNKEKEKRYKISKTKPDLKEEGLEKESQLTDEEIMEVISSEIKKEKEAIVLFEKGKRDDLVKKGTLEVEILEKYLPKQLTEKEIKKLVEAAITKVDAKEMRDFGKVMTVIMPELKGKADGSQVSKIVKDLLGEAEGK